MADPLSEVRTCRKKHPYYACFLGKSPTSNLKMKFSALAAAFAVLVTSASAFIPSSIARFESRVIMAGRGDKRTKKVGSGVWRAHVTRGTVSHLCSNICLFIGNRASVPLDRTGMMATS